MSLKAKLEAVIYAAEEPVTLTQLATLFATDALEWKAEQASQAAEAAAQAETESNHPLPLIPNEFDYLGLHPSEPDLGPVEPSAEVAEPADEPAHTTDPAMNPEPTLEADPEVDAEINPEADPETGPEATESIADPEVEAKRLARLRDREVRGILRQLLDELIASYAADTRGVEIREIAGGYRMATKPECHDSVRLFVKSLKPALKLSLPALETLAVVAYKQPVTAPEVNEIRGVDSSGVFGSLLARKLIATAGRKQVIGRPILYKTTKEFLLRFGLKDVAELPSMEEFEKMAAIELDEPEPQSGEASDSEADLNLDLNLSFELDEVTTDDAGLEQSPEDEPAGEPPSASTETPATLETAETAGSNEPPHQTEAAPAPPRVPEQAETETPPDAEKDHAQKVQEDQ